MQSNKISFKGENVYVGIDVHLNQWHVCVRTSCLSPKPFTMPPSAARLYEHLCRNYPEGSYHSAYEAGFCGFAPHYELTALGIDNIVFNPADINDSQKERVRKCDTVDCSKICRNLEQGNLKALFVPDKSLLADRSLVLARQTLVKERARTKQRIKSLLYYHGIAYPAEFADNRSHWSKAFVEWLGRVFDDAQSGNAVRMAIFTDNLRFINEKLLALDRLICKMIRERHSRTDALLRSVPGIGALTAAKLCVSLGDIRRFRSSDHLAGFIGLVPDTRSSDDKEVVLGLTFRGSRLLRPALIESSWRAITLDPALGAAYTALRNRGKHPNVAIVRIARKLVNRIYFVLSKETPYEPARLR